MTRSNPNIDASLCAASSSKPVTESQHENTHSKPKTGGSKRKNDDPTGQILAMMKKQIELVRYEVDVDPYRGIFDASGNRKGIFRKCAEVFSFGNSKNYDINSTNQNHQQEDSDNQLLNNNTDTICYGILCPCVSSWIQEEKQKLKASTKRKNKRRKNCIPRSLHRAPPKVPLTDDSSVVEIKVDEDDGDHTTQNSSAGKDPSEQLEDDINFNEEKTIDQEDDHKLDATRIRRNAHINYSCACDNNPFCLLSIGGVMDEYLQSLIEQSMRYQMPEPLLLTSKWNPKDVFDDRFSKYIIPLSRNYIHKISSNGADHRKDNLEELRAPLVVQKNSIVQYLRSVLKLSDAEVYARLVELDMYYTQLIFSGNICEVSDESEFKICRPVGISNLGATCYLNSQLQCLAANVAFMNGVLRWKDDGTSQNAQMNLVISRLQDLLAHMVHGANTIVSTGEFSSALGLENDEMQDPNEFARLLFDRMHESFQQSSPFLRTLLPSLFQGVFEYHTKCGKCCNLSTRRENFTDLNLPILVGEGESSSASMNTTVEELLHAYLKVEVLDGDNSYYCSVCHERISAERRVTFSNLPPVLNIQLARYVFDLKTFRKKKLMDKILLPRTLYIEKNDNEKHSYLLYAVQNHKGSSAYSGHYITEVMDWFTGIWFEFDDEKVKMQNQGPSSSYDPQISGRPKEGTSDAYNLFYVDTAFLKKTMNSATLMPSEEDNVINEILSERENRFNLQKEIESSQQKDLHRLSCRRTGILRFLLQGDCSLGVDPIWIAGDIFKRYMSCKDLMDDIFTANSTSSLSVFNNAKYICEHGQGLHPRIYRTGKLLSKEMFGVFCELLEAERRYVAKTNHLEPKSTQLFDRLLTAKHNIFCQCCVDDYRAQLRSKLDFASILVKLYVELDQMNEFAELDDVAYAIPKSFATALRRVAIKLFKQYSSIEVGSSVKCPSSGLDHFDLADWSLSKLDSKDDIDPTVTSSLTCPHGNCNSKNKRFVLYISKDTWIDICKLFPSAHSLLAHNGEIAKCQLCEKDYERNAQMGSHLIAWAINLSHDLRSVSEAENILHDNQKDQLFHIMDTNDIMAFDRAIDILRKAKKRGIDIPSMGTKLKYQILDIFFTQSANDQDELKYTRKLFNFNCERHKKPVVSFEELSHLTSTAAKNVQLVSPVRYSVMSSLMKELEDIILPEYHFPMAFVDYHPVLCIHGLSEKLPQEFYNLQKLVSDFSRLLRHEVKISWTSELCLDTKCIDCFSSTLLVDNMMFVSNPKEKVSKSSLYNSDVICLDDTDDVIDMVEFQVYEFDGSKSANECLSTVMKERVDPDEKSTLRRSSRNHGNSKTCFKFLADMNSNLAQIRLQVYEKSENKNLSKHRLSLLGLTDDEKPLDVELCHDWDDRSISFILKDLPIHLQSESKVELILSCKNAKSQDKLSKEENQTENDDSLFDMLVQIATCGDQPQVHTKRGKKRREERGFSGTFLQSSFQASSSDTKSRNSSSLPHTVDLTGFSQ